MRKRTKVILGICSAVIAVPLFLAIILFGLIYSSFPDFNEQEHLSDELLIQNFHRHRADFELLRSMLERDSHIFRIDDNWSDPANVSDDVLAKYRSMFERLGVPRGFYNRRDPLRIELIASSRGWVSSGSAKGYEYRLDTPKTLVTSLDRYHTEGSYSQYHRHIDGNWYLFFER